MTPAKRPPLHCAWGNLLCLLQALLLAGLTGRDLGGAEGSRPEEARPAAPDARPAIQLKAVTAEPLQVHPNLIPNASFEAVQPNGLPAGWQWDQRNTDARCLVDRETAHGGQCSLKLTNGTSFGAHVYGTFWRTQPIRLQAGKPHTLSAWVKSDIPGHAGLVGGGAWQVRVYAPATRGQWRRIWTSFTPGDQDTNFVLRINTESPTPAVWLDDLKLEEGAEPTPVEPAGPETAAVHLEPVRPEVEIQGDGPFNLALTLWTPRAMVCTAEVTLGSSGSLRQPLRLEAGGWKLLVSGEASAADDTPRTATVQLDDRDGRRQARAEVPVRCYSGRNALQRLAALRATLPALQSELDRAHAGGQDTAYPRVSYTVLENFIGYAEEDAGRQEVKRALRQVGELEAMAARLRRELDEARAGRRAFPAVPRWTGEVRPAIRCGSFVGPVHLPGTADTNRPIFFTGYGHFNQVVSDLEKWPAYGANIIQVEFGPLSVFPREGVVSEAPMRALRQTLDRAQKAGVAVCLLVSPHYFPRWALDKWPHLRRHREGFLQFCLHAPEGRELLRKFLAAAIGPLKDHPALHSVCLSNEPVNAEEPCEAGTREWHAWLQRRHLDLTTLNARWGTRFAAFDEIPLSNPFGPRPAGPVWMDYIRFNQEFFADWHGMLADAIHAVAPGLPVHAKAMTWTFLNDTDVRYGVDATLFAQFSQINGNDAVNGYSFGEGEFAQGWQMNAMGHDLQRSVLAAPVFNTENHLIADRETREVPAAHIRTALWQAAVHGQGATTIWVWERTFDPKSDFAGSIMHRPACAEAVGLLNHDLNRAALELTALQEAEPQVLVLQSVTASVWDFGRYGDCLGKLYTALAFTGLKTGFVTERQLERGVAPRAAVIFIPAITHLSDAAFAALERCTNRLVQVGSGPLLTQDESGRPRGARLRAESLPYRYGPTQWRALWQDLGSRLRDWNLVPAVAVRGQDGRPAWGVEWRSAETPNGRVVNLCNYRQEPVSVVLVSEGSPRVATDILSGERCPQVISLEPLETRLVRLAGP